MIPPYTYATFIATIIVGQLKEIFSELIEAKLLGHKPQEAERYLTAQETAKLLRISMPTLRARTEEGIFQRQTFGGKRLMYKQSDIEKAMVSFKKYQFKFQV